MKSTIIDKEVVNGVIKLLLEAEAAVDESSDGPASNATSAIRVVDAFLVPKFRYDTIKKLFHEYVYCSPFVCLLVNV